MGSSYYLIVSLKFFIKTGQIFSCLFISQYKNNVDSQISHFTLANFNYSFTMYTKQYSSWCEPSLQSQKKEKQESSNHRYRRLLAWFQKLVLVYLLIFIFFKFIYFSSAVAIVAQYMRGWVP